MSNINSKILTALKVILALCFFAPVTVFADYTLQQGASGSTAITTNTYAGSSAGSTQSWAYQFVSVGAGTVAKIDACLQVTGAGAGNQVVDIEADSGGLPSGTSLGSASLANSGLTTQSTYTFNFGSPVSLSGSTSYWVVMYSDTTLQYTQNCGDGGSGSFYHYSGGWGSPSSGAYMKMYVTEGGGGGGGGGGAATSSEATSTVDQTETNLWFAYWTFFATLVFIVWLFKRK